MSTDRLAADLSGLILLDFELIRAYQAAIRGATAGLRPHLARLMADHEEQARDLVAEAARLGGRPPTVRAVKGRQAAELAGLKDEAEMLGRLLAIEGEVAAAYAEAAGWAAGSPLAEVAEALGRFAARERGHTRWLKRRLGGRAG